jgi:predicted nucleic acid-binding protein
MPANAKTPKVLDFFTFTDVLEAARVKAQFPLSYADAFAISTALRSQAMVVTGDPEFRAVAHLVEILWL